jgi:hypothetical protein
LRRKPVVDFEGKRLRHSEFAGGTSSGIGEVLWDITKVTYRIVAFAFGAAVELWDAAWLPIMLLVLIGLFALGIIKP